MAERRVQAAAKPATNATSKAVKALVKVQPPKFEIVDMFGSNSEISPFQTGVWSAKDGKPEFGYRISYSEDGLMLESGTAYERASCVNSFSADGELYMTDCGMAKEEVLRHLDALEAAVKAARKHLTQ